MCEKENKRWNFLFGWLPEYDVIFDDVTPHRCKPQPDLRKLALGKIGFLWHKCWYTWTSTTFTIAIAYFTALMYTLQKLVYWTDWLPLLLGRLPQPGACLKLLYNIAWGRYKLTFSTAYRDGLGYHGPSLVKELQWGVFFSLSRYTPWPRWRAFILKIV